MAADSYFRLGLEADVYVKVAEKAKNCSPVITVIKKGAKCPAGLQVMHAKHLAKVTSPWPSGQGAWLIQVLWQDPQLPHLEKFLELHS